MTFSRTLCAALALFCFVPAEIRAQSPPAPNIKWEVANRFRLFKHNADFERVKKAHDNARGSGTGILGAEHALDVNGRGWLPALSAYCYNPDDYTKPIKEDCERDRMEEGASSVITEKYLNPVSHPVRLSLADAPDLARARCTWTIGDRRKVQPKERECDKPVAVRLAGKAPVTVSVTVRGADSTVQELRADILVRDLLIIGMGDSMASGEGNPHRPVNLTETGFCFERFKRSALPFSRTGRTGELIYLPGRAGTGVQRACPQSSVDERARWDKARAGWLFTQCHRSLYSSQARAALALAIEQEHVAVTFVPLGCTGATIAEGMLDSQLSREIPIVDGFPANDVVEGQVSQLRNMLRPITGRKPDLILLTIGANDIEFSGLVADAITQPGPERRLMDFGGMIATPDTARPLLHDDLKADFALLRPELQAIMGGSLDHVIFTTYANPALHEHGATCPTGRRGFDVHPAFGVNGGTLKSTSQFVEHEFIPFLKDYALCGPKGGCADQTRQAMRYVDSHRKIFEDHGFCAVDPATDPEFDTRCFRADGRSFRTDAGGLALPMTCGKGEFKAYAKRARWIRTANDAYFAAMTYADSLPDYIQGENIHDAIWGLTAGVYGGAVHPTAEGHAAIADALLPVARDALGLTAPPVR